jgi:hypothetical protein
MLDLVHGTERVPATLLLPARAQPVPAALLLHGLSSNKERMAQAVGRTLQSLGVASLAVDLPLHGERDGAREDIPFRNPLALVSAWTAAVSEASAAIEWLAAQPEIDAGRIAVVGYSLGGFIALLTAADTPMIRVVALAAAGDLPNSTPYAALVRRAVDPLRAVHKLAGRPLLMLNGTNDRTTQPIQAERLFALAEEPKQMIWYEGGHWPPQSAIDEAAEWTTERLRELSQGSGQRATG